MKKITEFILNIINVNLEILSWILVLLLSGCNKAEVLVSSLGRPIPTPILTSAKIDPSSFCNPTYIEYEGQCHEKVKSFDASLDQENWQSIPIKVPVYDGTGKLSTFEESVQDVECGPDKKFKFKVSLIWIEKTFKVNKSEVNTIYLRGVDGTMTSLALPDNTLNGKIQACNVPSQPKGKDYGVDKTADGSTHSGSIYRLKGGLIHNLGHSGSHGIKYGIKSESSKLTQ